MAAKGGKKVAANTNRAGSATTTPRETASVAASAASLEKKPKITIWPEWNDADVNAEKWDVAHKGKEDKKGKSPTAQQHYFEDPDGKLELPTILRVNNWKRPQDYFTEKTPVVVDTEHMAFDFDLITNNEHLHESEVMRTFISIVTALWELCMNKGHNEISDASSVDDPLHTWRPWEHIYSLCKVSRHHLPLFNPHGKYIVRLYWMGCWRKIMVDDLLPFDENNQLLLPSTTLTHELWPMLLAKALIKISSLDCVGGLAAKEYGDTSMIHCLTGWLLEMIPLHTPPSFSATQVIEKYYSLLSTNSVHASGSQDKRHGHLNEVWELLKSLLPEWHLPEPESEKLPETSSELAKKEGSNHSAAVLRNDTNKEEKTELTPVKETKSEVREKVKEGTKEKTGKENKEKTGKDDKKEKKEKDKDKDKSKEKYVPLAEDTVVPEKPEVVVFAIFGNPTKTPVKVSMLCEMADASERLRQNGLSHIHPHPVCIAQTRSCPLEPPPPPEIIPAWKLIRPRKKKEQPSDEPRVEPEPPKDVKCLEISSPFVNYKVSPVPIPTETYRTKSSLERGFTHSRPATSTVQAIEETDENISEFDQEPHLLQTPDILTFSESLKEISEEGGLAGTKQKGITNTKLKNSVKRDRSGFEFGEAADRSGGKIGSAKGERNKSAKKNAGTRREDSEEKKDKAKEKGDIKSSVLSVESSVPLSQAGAFDSACSLIIEPGDIAEEMIQEHHTLNREEGNLEIPKPKKRWIDFDQFCVCFRTLYIFHKPNTYICNQRLSDLKNVTPSSTPVPTKGDKKTTVAVSGGLGLEDKSSYFLFVDNLKPTEIVISYAVIPRWFDPPVIEEKKGVKLKDKEKEMEKDPMGFGSFCAPDVSITREHVSPIPVSAGTLVAEPHSWKSLVTGQPIMRLRTTGIRGAVLSLPAGRHVLRFMMTAPLGYHVHMCATVNFVFGDEETVMPHLTQESCRFRENALQVINSLGKCISTYTDAEQFAGAWEQFVTLHCPYMKNKLFSKQKHFQNFNASLYSMLRKALRDIASPEVALAWRSFNFDAVTPNILSLPFGSRPATGSASTRGSAKPGSKKPVEKAMEGKVVSEPEKTEFAWAARYLEPTPEDHVAAVKIQKVWRGFWVRKIKQARTPGTDENAKAYENLQKSWTVIEHCAEENGLFLFRELFKKDSTIMPQYPFYKDEWNKISYADYKGIFPEQHYNTWFVVFREIFFVKEETLAVPKLYVHIPTCMLRVIDNDTGHELPTVFQKVAPYVYKRNKKGYTFVAEARTLEQPLASGPWRMRLIGSTSILPAPRTLEMNSNFHVKVIQDFYLPNPKNIIFRYSVKVTEDQLCSLQVSTSKYDVYVHLSVLDNEEEVASATGKGHVVVPAYVFSKDATLPGDDAAQTAQPQADARQSSSRISNRGGVTRGMKGRHTESAKSTEGRTSRSSPQSDVAVSEDLEANPKETKPHKYIIQATVMKNSWPLSESAWAFVQALKEQEKNDLQVINKERPQSPKYEKSPPVGQKAKSKGGKIEKNSRDKDKNSRPPSQTFNSNQPNWILRVVVDALSADDLEIKKDTERADEIRSMKKAWEDAEPGRAAKALQSRLKYLNSHIIKLEDDIEGEGGTEALAEEDVVHSQTPHSVADSRGAATLDTETVLYLEPPASTPKKILRPLDITPFIKKTRETPLLLDEAEMQRLLEERQKQIAEYKEFRQQVEAWRAQDRAARNQTKIKQMDDAQALQTNLDLIREAVNVPREAFRQRYLEAERKRQEELALQEAVIKAEQETKTEKNRKSAKGKESGKKKKK